MRQLQVCFCLRKLIKPRRLKQHYQKEKDTAGTSKGYNCGRQLPYKSSIRAAFYSVYLPFAFLLEMNRRRKSWRKNPQKQNELDTGGYET